MTEHDPEKLNVAPGQPHDSILSETVSYVIGLVLALAFGVLIVFLVMVGTIWIMGHMNSNMMPEMNMMDLHNQRG